MRGDNNLLRLVVIVVERRRERAIHSDYGSGIDLSIGRPSFPRAVRKDFVGAIMGPPCDRRKRTNQTTAVLVGSHESSALRDHSRISFRHDAADGFPIQTRGRLLS